MVAGSRFDAAATWASAQAAVRNVGAAVARWNDPRRRLLRKRRAARRATFGLGSVTGAFTAGTVSLAALDAPTLLVASGCGVTALAAVPTVAVAGKLRQLYRTPLPPERALAAVLPGRGSAAHLPLRRLATAEASLLELVRLLDTDVTVPSSEVREAASAAAAAAVALRREGAELAALERARDTSAVAAAELSPVVHHAAARLDRGVGEYERLVAAAARAVATTSKVAAQRGGLTDAVDRIDALTEALTELAGIHGPWRR